MINLEQELDRALAQIVDLEDQLEEKDDAIRALLTAKTNTEAELESLRIRNKDLELAEASRSGSVPVQQMGP